MYIIHVIGRVYFIPIPVPGSWNFISLSHKNNDMATIADISQTLGDYMLKGWVHNRTFTLEYFGTEATLPPGFDRPTLSDTWLHRSYIKISPRQNTANHLLCQVQQH